MHQFSKHDNSIKAHHLNSTAHKTKVPEIIRGSSEKSHLIKWLFHKEFGMYILKHSKYKINNK